MSGIVELFDWLDGVSMPKILLVFVAVWQFFASPVQANRLMDSIMGSWMGAHIDQAVAQWGFPDAEEMILGRHILTWKDDAHGVGNLANCLRKVQIDRAGTIIGVDYTGNNCPFMEVGPFAKWRRK